MLNWDEVAERATVGLHPVTLEAHVIPSRRPTAFFAFSSGVPKDDEVEEPEGR